jgi:hypothetical protein
MDSERISETLFSGFFSSFSLHLDTIATDLKFVASCNGQLINWKELKMLIGTARLSKKVDLNPRARECSRAEMVNRKASNSAGQVNAPPAKERP